MTEPVAEYDVIILGAGINGCGTFLDLALQGVRVLMLERGDICQGASAASSRLMHGGLKYLETGEFRLVRESLTERNMLLATAPHYVRPLECVVPVTSTFGGVTGSVARFLGRKAKINDRGFFITAVGLAVYDLYGRAFRSLPRSRMLRSRALRGAMPNLAPAITGAGIYFEGQITHAERLGLELVLDAEAVNPKAHVETYATVTGVEGGAILWTDRHGRSHRAQAKVVVNAGGAWIDRVNATLGIQSRLMGGSRGSHLVVDHPQLLQALGGRMVYFGTPDGRVNLLYPFAGRVLIGATDIPQGDPDSAACDENEEAYLCAAASTVFPDIPVKRHHVVHRFCGVRPLPRADGEIGLVTRDHSIVSLALAGTDTPVLCLIGGKWTTFRAFAELATDRILSQLGMTRRISTTGRMIGGGKGFPRDAAGAKRLSASLARSGGISEERANELLHRYGTRVGPYIAGLRGQGETRLRTLPDFAVEEIRHIAATERVVNLDDLLQRRTLIALSGRDRPPVREEISDILDMIVRRESA